MKYSALTILILGGVLGAAVACSDTASPPTTPKAQSVSTTIASEEAPAEAPPELQVPTILYSVRASAGYESNYAYAQSNVSYNATNALSQATVTMNGASETGERSAADAFPWDRNITASALKYAPCVGTISAKAYGKIWMQFGGFTWAEHTDNDFSSAECPAPPPSSGGGGGGGSGSSKTSCYTLTIDYYWYYPDTGRYEWFGRDQFSWCETEDEM
jgi:hypothetical protein